MARTVTTRQLRSELARYLKEAEAGEDIVVTSRGRAVARLVPPPPAVEPKRLGALKGLFEVPDADDFNETPLEIIEAMEGADEET